MNSLTLMESYFTKTAKDALYYDTLMESEKKILSKNAVSRLIKTIKDKALKINYMGIEKTKGDITKFSKYEDLENSIKILNRMYQANPNNSPMQILDVVKTLESVKNHKNDWLRGFASNNEVVILLYTNLVASLISATSKLILATIEYIKNPDGSYTAIFKANYLNSIQPEDTYFKSLNRYLSMEKTGELNKLFNNNSKIVESFEFSYNNEKMLNEDIIVLGLLGIAAVFTFILFIRDLVFLFYYQRTKIADSLMTLAYFLQQNANELDQSTSKGKATYEKQMKMVAKLQRLADKIDVDERVAKRKAQQDIENSDEDISDVGTNDSSGSNDGGILL